MLWVNLPIADTCAIHSKGNEFVMNMKIKATDAVQVY